MLTSTELKEQLQAAGADVVGVAAADSPLFGEHDDDPARVLPGARSVIAMGVALNPAAVTSGNINLTRYDTMCVYERLDHVYLEAMRLLGQNGARAVAVPPFLPQDMGPEIKGMKGDINHKTAAAIAGLGTIGLNRLLINPRLGPFVRLSTIVTDAVLEPDDLLAEDPCDQCGLCVEACPVEALADDGTLNYRACTPYVLSPGLPGIIATGRKLIGADEQAVKAVLYSPEFWDIWQAAASGTFYNCVECMAACPVGAGA